MCYFIFIQLAASGEPGEVGNRGVWSAAVYLWNSNLDLSSLSSPSLLILGPILILLQLCKRVLGQQYLCSPRVLCVVTTQKLPQYSFLGTRSRPFAPCLHCPSSWEISLLTCWATVLMDRTSPTSSTHWIVSMGVWGHLALIVPEPWFLPGCDFSTVWSLLWPPSVPWWALLMPSLTCAIPSSSVGLPSLTPLLCILSSHWFFYQLYSSLRTFFCLPSSCNM